MAKTGEWADALVVVAMAHMLQHDILVLTSSPQTSDQQFFHWIYGAPNFIGQPIMVGHEYEFHYHSLEAIGKKITNLSLDMMWIKGGCKDNRV